MSADSRGFIILNIIDQVSRPTITESVVESADYAVESADCTADSSEDPVKIGLWVRAFTVELKHLQYSPSACHRRP